MNRYFSPAILAALLLNSCLGSTGKMVLNPAEMQGISEAPYIITDHKNIAREEEMPDWVIAFIDEGVTGVEALGAFQDRYVFIARNEGTNFDAMKYWISGFDVELDYPRLAAARIEARFFSVAPLPDQEYGAFFEELIRTASDYQWTSAVRMDDFWIRKNYIPMEDESEREAWEFMILLTIDKTTFYYQLETVFKNAKPNPPPTKDQANAIARVKERFFEGF